jgi:hypothetical protein
MRITEEVWQVGGGSLTAVEDAAIYLICFDKQAALIDAGTGKAHDRLVLNIENCGVSASQIEYLFLTLDIDILCEGHFGIFRGRREIHEYI